MRFVASALMVLGIAAFTSGCCCPLDCLSLCLGGGGGQIPTGLTAAAAADRANLDEIPAGVPVVVKAASQRF